LNCTILTIGTELLMGQIINSNATFLSKELNEIGINVLYHISVGDNPKRLEGTLAIIDKLSDIIITTGGLGPTQDDISKEIISKYYSKKLILHEPSLEKLKNFFHKINKEMTSNNIKQAYLPDSSIILDNEFGTAPGFIIEENNKTIISLPGPPKEMTNMYLNQVKPYLLTKSNQVIQSQILKFVGIGESKLESELQTLIDNHNPTLATYANNGEVSLRITAKAASSYEANTLIAPILETIRKKFSEYIYSFNNETLEEVVAKLLIENNISISLAESCTGGLLATKLTSIPGISKVFDRGIICYSNNSKIKELSVDREIIEFYGAVSKETALAMCEGLKKVTKSDLAISITGIAGPDGATVEKPVGLVYIGVASKDRSFVKKFNLHGSRDTIRNYSTIHALNIIRKLILGENIC